MARPHTSRLHRQNRRYRLGTNPSSEVGLVKCLNTSHSRLTGLTHTITRYSVIEVHRAIRPWIHPSNPTCRTENSLIKSETITAIGTPQGLHQKNPGNDPGIATCTEPECCQHIALKDRSLLSPIQAGGLAAVFKVLANDTRLRLLHALVRADELCVSDLANSLGMKPQAISNQLQRLSDLGILRSRRQGNSIHYQLVDLCVRSLLDQGLCLMEEVTSRESNRSLINQACKVNKSC